jgi:ribosomal-protein-alanine N-acetyltransferase
VELERLTPENYGRVAEWLSDPAINRWLAARWQNRTFDERHVAMIVAPPSTRVFLIRDGGEPAGVVALTEIDTVERSASMWCVIGPERRTKGLGTAAMRAAIRIAFEELKLASIWAWVTEGNEAALKMDLRVGFKRAGTFRRGALLDGKLVDRWLIDLLPEDFRASCESEDER